MLIAGYDFDRPQICCKGETKDRKAFASVLGECPTI